MRYLIYFIIIYLKQDYIKLLENICKYFLSINTASLLFNKSEFIYLNLFAKKYSINLEKDITESSVYSCLNFFGLILFSLHF